MQSSEFDAWHMARALELAARGEGLVEPNPMVGCAIVRDGETVGEGFHTRFGGPHAEVEALANAGPLARGATAYVTIEPCCHYGKTPPCTQALIRAGISRVVIARRDPFPQVDGGGIAELERAGIQVDVGLRGEEADELLAPYLKLVTSGRPWVIAKWAMSLDGKLATRTGDSRWISCEASRAIVHRLRGRVDGILVGSRTAALDDPLLTARPPGVRIATRIVVDSSASLSTESNLVRTARETPVLVAVAENALAARQAALTAAGCEVTVCPGATHAARLSALLDELGRRRMTNLLVEGGGAVLGEFFDASQIDEVHVFIAPKLIGGAGASAPLAALGIERMDQAIRLKDPIIEPSGSDVYVHGCVQR